MNGLKKSFFYEESLLLDVIVDEQLKLFPFLLLVFLIILQLEEVEVTVWEKQLNSLLEELFRNFIVIMRL